jgi:hypothetical protein
MHYGRLTVISITGERRFSSWRYSHTGSTLFAQMVTRYLAGNQEYVRKKSKARKLMAAQEQVSNTAFKFRCMVASGFCFNFNTPTRHTPLHTHTDTHTPPLYRRPIPKDQFGQSVRCVRELEESHLVCSGPTGGRRLG